jgi:hypothetical protein
MALTQVDRDYYAYLEELHQWAMGQYVRFWKFFDPERIGSLQRVAPALLLIHETAVRAALYASDDYATLKAAESGTLITPPDWQKNPNWKDRPSRVASGATMEDVLNSVRSGFLWQMKQGDGVEHAAQLAQGRSVRPIGSEPAQVMRNYTWDLVLDPQAMEDDGVFRQWRRVPRPGACDFCLMLATRGAAYRTRESALFTEDGRRYHDFCRCTAQLVTSAYNRADVAIASQDAKRTITYRNSSGVTYTYNVADYLPPPPLPVWQQAA